MFKAWKVPLLQIESLALIRVWALKCIVSSCCMLFSLITQSFRKKMNKHLQLKTAPLATSHMLLFYIWSLINENSATQKMQCLGLTNLDNEDVECFPHYRKFYWTALLQRVLILWHDSSYLAAENTDDWCSFLSTEAQLSRSWVVSLLPVIMYLRNSLGLVI